MDFVSSLARLSWRKVFVRLVNTRNTFAREPPISVIESILKHARPQQNQAGEVLCFFHPAEGRLPVRVLKDAQYALELVFPRATREEVETFLGRLREHLADPRRNFELRDVGEIQERNLERLLAESGPPCGLAGDLCLEFITPFPFHPKVRGRPWLISRDDFFRAFVGRLHRLFGTDPAGAEVLWKDVIILPYYWRYDDRLRHGAKSTQGEKWINGVVGPLYLKGDLNALYPLLVACSELHAGTRVSYAQGYYRIRENRAFFDDRLCDLSEYRKALAELDQSSDVAAEIAQECLDTETFILDLRDSVAAGAYEFGACPAFSIAKKQGGTRLIGSLRPRDYLVQKVLQGLLAPVVDRMLEDASVGYRRGRSRETARRMIADAYREGYTYVLESDIESFFDQMDWDILLEKLRKALPAADCLTLSLLEKAIRMDIEIDGRVEVRTRGLLTGSPLSPMLSNLYLDSFDEEMEQKGYKLVRYGDDFLILTRTREEAERALEEVRTVLAGLKLSVKEGKTRIKPVDLGFTFLGLDLGQNLDEEFVEKTTLRKTLFVRPQYAFLGVDADSIVIRKGKEALARLPLKRIGEIIVFGNNTLSTRLIHKCSQEQIPISFCSPSGYYMNTLRPDSKRYFDISGRHAARHAATTEEERLNLAAKIVAAKLGNYAEWLNRRYGAGAREECARLKESIAALAKADSVEIVRGIEGQAARHLFAFLNARAGAHDVSFASAKREKHKKADRFNSMLDFAYFLLFGRLNVLVRSQGLNPYLGFLHSPKDHFESLVFDLEEPFRWRMDRLVLKLINLNIIKPDDFEPLVQNGQQRGFRLKAPAVGRFVAAFENDLSTRMAGDGGSLRQLLVAQVRAVLAWVDGGSDFVVYRTQSRQ